MEPRGLTCPSCGSYNVLLVAGTYTAREDIDPGQILAATGRQDAVFAVVAADGGYLCGNPDCRQSLG
jgi:hypothetical protein